MTDRAPARPAETRALLLFVLLALGLRLWGIGFGMPYPDARPDEGKVAGIAAGFAAGGSLNPNFFAYPSLFMYVLGGVYAAACGVGTATHLFTGFTDCVNADAQLIVMARVLVSLLGAAAVAVVFAVGRRMERGAGLPAALLLAVAFLHVRDSHFAVTDVPMITLLLLAVLLLLRADERPSTRSFAVAGLVTGLAASTKYNAAFLAGAAVVSQLYASFSDSEVPASHSRLAIFGAAAAIGFFVATPYALVSPARFLEDVTFESLHLMYPHHGIVVDGGWRHHTFVTLPQGVGWPLLVAGVAGSVLLLAARRRQAWIVFSFPLIYYVVAARGQTVFARYMLPVVPFICLGAGALIARAHAALGRQSRLHAHAVAAAMLTACALPTGAKSVMLDRLLSRTDSRVLAAEWIKRRVPAGATILLTGEGFDLSPPPGERGYDVRLWRDAAGSITGPRAARPDWIAVEQSPLRFYSRVPPELEPILHEYDFRHAIQAVKLSEPHIYDQQDAFYLPLDGFSGVSRPGPNFVFYERRRAGSAAMNGR